MYEVWERERLLELQKLRFFRSLASLIRASTPEGVSGADKAIHSAIDEISVLLLPAQKKVREDLERRGKETLERWRKKSLRVRTHEDASGNLDVELEV